MKLTTALIFGVFTIGAAYSQADNYYYGDHKHHGRGHFKHSEHRDHRACEHRRSAPVSRERGDGYTEASYARVINVEPVYRYYKEPVRDHSCVRHEPGRSAYNSYTATVLGAVIGGALGHRIGDAHGDPTVAAVAGGLLGASIGRDFDRRASYNRGLRVEGPCRVTHREQTRRQLVEYKVSYRYNGEVHLARMDYDPGEWVKLDVNVTPA